MRRMVAKLSWIVPGLILDASDRAYSAAALPAKAKKSGLSAADFNRYHCIACASRGNCDMQARIMMVGLCWVF
jgi:hypothetical protein